MASQKAYIIDNPDHDSDGIIKDREKNQIGRAWNQPAPNGTYIQLSLEKHWIISDEDYKLLNKLKKNVQ